MTAWCELEELVGELTVSCLSEITPHPIGVGMGCTSANPHNGSSPRPSLSHCRQLPIAGNELTLCPSVSEFNAANSLRPL